MKRSTRWTTAIAAATLLAVPPAARAQAPAPTTAPSPPAQRAADSAQQPASGAEHLRQAEAALNDIRAASLAGPATARIAELKRHINNLEKSAGSSSSARSATPRGANWGTEVAAADRILSELLGPEGATGAPAPTGTSGTTRSKMGAAITLDDTTRSKLQDVRTHITAFAASMSNTPGAPGAEASAAAAAPSEPSANAAANAPAAAAAAPAQPEAPTPTAETPAPTRSPATPAEPAPAAAQNPQSPQPPAPSTPAAPSASPAPAQSAQQVDPDTVKRYLTAARNSLSELTQLPAAAQLTGDARAQVSQLITNFNELITANADWKAAYAKVQANLNTLIGDQRTDESPAPAAGAAGAVGTSGTVTLDPAIRSKLVEFRTHLMEFEKAASGGARNSAEPAASPAASPAPTPNEAAANPAASAAQPSAPQTPTEQPQPSTAARNAPRASATTGAVGTTGSAAATPTPADTAQAPESRASTPSSRQSHGANQSEAMRHIEAIEAILNGRAATGTSGKESKAATPGTLDRAQIEQIKTHLAELRKALNQER